MSDDVVGVWLLDSMHMEKVETGERSEPFGPHPRGTLILHPGGRMVALITPGERPATVGDAGPAPASPQLVAYSGRYRLEPPDRFVTAVDVAWFEAWVGTDQVRNYKLEGDRLEIVTTPTRLPGDNGREAAVIGVLSWTRETAAPAGSLEPASD